MFFWIALLVVLSDGFACSLYGSNNKVVFFKRDISTTYPPERASCWILEDVPVGFQKIQCAAKAGVPAGSLICYQFGKQVPPCDYPRKNNTHIFQEFSIHANKYVHCCSESDGRLMNITTCADWYLNDLLMTTTSESLPDVSLRMTTNANNNLSTSPMIVSPSNETIMSVSSKLFARIKALFAWISLLTIVVMLLIAFIIYSKRHPNSQGTRLQSGDGQDDDEGSSL